MSEMVEAIKLIGAVVGLATGAFVCIDRMRLGRPRVTWHRTQTGLAVSIFNTANGSIFFEPIAICPAYRALAEGSEAVDDAAAPMTLVKGQQNTRIRSFVLEQGTEKIFPIVRGVDQRPEDELVCVVARWRFCRRNWMPQVAVKLRDTAGFLKRFEAAQVTRI